MPRPAASSAAATKAGRDPGRPPRYVIETRRARYTHWGIVFAAPLFVLWNPWALWLAMVACAVIANVPCLVIQRYNQTRVLRILDRRGASPR